MDDLTPTRENLNEAIRATRRGDATDEQRALLEQFDAAVDAKLAGGRRVIDGG